MGPCVLAIALIEDFIYGCRRNRQGGLCFLLPVPRQARLYTCASAFIFFSHPMTLSHHFSMHQGETQLLLSSEQHRTNTPGLPEGGAGGGWATRSTLCVPSEV